VGYYLRAIPRGSVLQVAAPAPTPNVAVNFPGGNVRVPPPSPTLYYPYQALFGFTETACFEMPPCAAPLRMLRMLLGCQGTLSTA